MALSMASQETLDAIRVKALNNAKKLGTYKTRSSFQLGKDIETFSELCAKSSKKN